MIWSLPGLSGGRVKEPGIIIGTYDSISEFVC